MSTETETLVVDAKLDPQAAMASLAALQAAAEKLQKTLAGLRIPAASVAEQKDWNAERQQHAQGMAAIRLGERGSTVAEAIDKRQGVASTVLKAEEQRGENLRQRGQNQTQSTAAAKELLQARLTYQKGVAGSRIYEANQLNEARKAGRLERRADKLIDDAASVLTVEQKEAARTQGAQDRLEQKGEFKQQQQAIADQRRKDREAEQAAKVAANKDARSQAGLLQAFALQGAPGAGRYFLGQQMQRGANWAVGAVGQGAAASAQYQAAQAAYQQQLFAWQTNLGGGARGAPPTPPKGPGFMGGFGGMGGMLAGGAAGGAVVAAGSMLVGYNQISGHLGKYRGWERGLRGSAGMGNYTDIKQLREDPLAQQATDAGIGHEEYMSAKAEYLRARGRRTAFSTQENADLIGGINQGLEASTIGRWNRLQRGGVGLVGRGRSVVDAAYGLHSAGLTEDDMRGSVQSMLGFAEQAAAKGRNYDWTQHVGMTKGLSSAFGDPGRARSVTEGIAGAGRNSLQSLEAGLQQISDMSVLAGMAGETSDPFELLAKLKSASPTERLRHQQRVGALAFQSYGSPEEAAKLAGLDPRVLTGELEQAPLGYDTRSAQFSKIAARGEAATDRMALEGNTAEEVAKLHATIQAWMMSFGTMLPEIIQNSVYAGVRMAGGG